MCKTVGMHFDSICVLNPTTIVVFCTVYISVNLSTNSSLLIDFHPSLHFCHYLLSCSFLSLKKATLPSPRPAPFLLFVGKSLQGMKFSFLFDWEVSFYFHFGRLFFLFINSRVAGFLRLQTLKMSFFCLLASIASFGESSNFLSYESNASFDLTAFKISLYPYSLVVIL